MSVVDLIVIYIMKFKQYFCFLLFISALIPVLSHARTDLFFDDFERSSLGSDWTVVKGDSRADAAIGTYIANSGTRSMYTCCRELTVTSKAIDLSGLNYAELTFWLRSGSDDYSEWPSSGDDLHVEILLSNNTWEEVKIYEGGGSSDGDEYFFRAKIPTTAYHANFKFRFRQIDGSGTSTKRDFWHIDDVRVIDHEVGSVQYPLFYDGFERNLLISTLDWVVDPVDARFNSEISNHSSVTGSKSMYSCCGEMYTTTRNIDLSGLTFAEIEFWVQNGDDNFSGTDFFTFGNYDGETPSSGDDIRVEAYMSDGQWHEIDYYYGTTSTPGKERWYRASVPDEGFHNEFKLRFHQIDGSLSSSKRYDMWHIDEVYVGTRDDESAAVDHFRLSYGSAALTCNPHDVTIQACKDSSCSELYTDSVIATLSPSGWAGGDTITFSGGSASLSLSHTTAETITVDVSSSTPAASGSGTQCSIDSGSFSAACGLTFATSGFIVDIPDFLSARGETATISAVREGDASQQCVPAFASTVKTLSLWSDYVLPTSGSANISLNGITIGTSSGTATTQVLSFNASGQATPSINYSDAGKMRLQVKYTGVGTEAGLIMEGEGEFIARPAGMCVYPEASTACGSPYTNCIVYKKAGESFDLINTAVAWESDSDSEFCDNAGTPNYSASNITLAASLISPMSGRTGTFTPSTYNHSVASGGANSISSVESEVGVFTFNATPPLYQGAALGSLVSTSLVTYTSQPTGRFIPAYFSIAETTPGTLGSCVSGNLYSGETTTWGTAPSFSISARNMANAITTNYTESSYLKLTEADISSDLVIPTEDSFTNDTDGTPLVVTFVQSLPTLTVSSHGVLNYTFNANDTFAYTRSDKTEINEFTPDLRFSFPATINDGEAVVSPKFDFNVDASSVSVRFGRLWVEDSYGPETSDLTIPLRTEYFSNSKYVLNTLDDCTVWDAANASVATLSEVEVSSGTLVNGSSGANGIVLNAPSDVTGTPDTGEATVTYDAPSWLEGDYNNDGTFEDPESMVLFGINRGHERLIYRKEVR